MAKHNQGGRPATGSVKWRRNAKTGVAQWHARVTLKDGSRPFVPSMLTRGFGSVSDPAETSDENLLEIQALTVELTGIEPVTSCMPCKRSPN